MNESWKRREKKERRKKKTNKALHFHKHGSGSAETSLLSDLCFRFQVTYCTTEVSLLIAIAIAVWLLRYRFDCFLFCLNC